MNKKDELDQLEAMQQRLARQEQEIAGLRAEIERLSRRDALTGALNRHTLTDVLAAELRRAHRTGHPFCFAAIEVDGFAELGERLGTPASDDLLVRLASAAMGHLRALDAFGRLGDSKFGILLPATWLDHGVIALDRLTAALKAVDWKAIAPELSPRFSCGLTTNAPLDSADIMVERAVQALTQAKNEGGDRITTLECDLPPMPPLPED